MENKTGANMTPMRDERKEQRIRQIMMMQAANEGDMALYEELSKQGVTVNTRDAVLSRVGSNEYFMHNRG